MLWTAKHRYVFFGGRTRAAHATIALFAFGVVSTVAAQTSQNELIHLRAVAGESRVVEYGPLLIAIVSTTITPALDVPIRVDMVEHSGVRGLRLMIPPATPPGRYKLDIKWRSADGHPMASHLNVTVDPILIPRAVAAPTARVPVVLLNGWQLICTNLDSTLAASRDTFGYLADLLETDGAPVLFFNNCSYGDLSIEALAGQLNAYLAGLHYTDGTPVSQVDLVAHSMGGLIARAYLSGKGQVSGTFAPPSNHKVRKLVTIATPHFGSFQASSFGVQEREMVVGSQFLWDLARWNQHRDDLRGVDALAVVGNAGWEGSLTNASDGVVSLTSASLGFLALAFPDFTGFDQRTRIVPYCHIDPGFFTNFGMSCTSSTGIAKVDAAGQHPTAQIVRSFLGGTSNWTSSAISTTPSQNSYLSQYGGIYFAQKNSADAYITDLTQVLWGGVTLQGDGAAGTVYYGEFVQGTGQFEALSTSLGTFTCGVFSESVGYYNHRHCKQGPIINGVTSNARAGISGLSVASGSAITIQGVDLVTASGATGVFYSAMPPYTSFTPMSLSSAGSQSITSFLPAGLTGLIVLAVTNSDGQAFTNIMAAPPTSAALSITKTHAGNFRQGQQGVTFSVTVSNAAAAGPTSGTVIVAETAPPGLTLVSMSGTGWTCPATAANNCARSDVLDGGASYPPIVVSVNVAQNATSPQINQVSVSGGGSTSANANDSTVIDSPSTSHVRGDFCGNGVPDVALQFPDGSMGVWCLAAIGRSLPITAFNWLAGPSSGISLVNVADVNRDGTQDLILRLADGSIGVWYMGGPHGYSIIGFAFISGPITGWMPMSMADLNGDGYLDLVIQNIDGTIGVWYLGGAGGNQIQGFALISGPIGGWKLVGMSDLNNDGHPDAILQYIDGTIGVWYLSGTAGNQIQGFATIAGASTWLVAGAADMDADGHPDLMIRNGDGTLGVWYLGGAQGAQITAFAPITTPGNTSWRELTPH